MISIDAIGVEFSGKTLFSDVSFVINENDKMIAGIIKLEILISRSIRCDGIKTVEDCPTI